MNKEVISDKEGIATIILFIVGAYSVFVIGLEAEKDVWLAILLAMVISFPMVSIFARLQYIFPNKDFFDLIKICFGEFIGKGIIILFTLYFLFWTTIVLVNFGNFITIVSLTKTPKIILMIALIILCAWGIKAGIEVLGRWGDLFVIVISIIFVTIILLIPKMDINNIRPVLLNGIKPVLKGAFKIFIFPFAQISVFTIVYTNFQRRKSPYKIYNIGLLIGGIVLLMTSLTDILVMGVNSATSVYYPSYATVARMKIGDMLQRLEVIVAIVFILGGFLKIAILLLCTCKGFAKIFNCNDYRFIVMPISLLVINLSYFSFDSVMNFSKHGEKVYPYYAFLFHVVFPIIIFIIVEINKKRLVGDQSKISGEKS